MIADALKLNEALAIEEVLSKRVALLESQQIASQTSYSNLLKLSEEKYLNQKEITSDMVRLSSSWKEESDYFQKRSKKFRRQRNGVAAGLVAVIILTLIQ